MTAASDENFSLSERYFKFEEEKKELLEESNALIHEKIQMVSVKEAVVGAIDELNNADVAFGCDISHGGSYRATDVIGGGGSGASQWMSLREQVIAAVEDTNSVLSSAHRQCCNRVKVQCNTFHELRERYLLAEGNNSPDSISVGSGVSDSYSVSIVDPAATFNDNTEFSSIRRVKSTPARMRQSRKNR